MRPIQRLVGRKHSLTFGGTGTFEQPMWWYGEAQRDAEEMDANFAGYVSGAYKANGIVFACILVRQLVFSEARFLFQQREASGRYTDLIPGPGLELLDHPWPGGTTGELLARMEQDASLAGNFYGTKISDPDGDRIRRMRPDWVTIITGSRSGGGPTALDARVVGYVYEPKMGVNRPDPVLLLPSEVAHWSPIPDPDAQWRGMSWITPIVNEVKGDQAATKHKLKYFEHGTVGGVSITYDKGVSPEAVERFARMWKDQHTGTDNAYKTFHLGGGADAKTLGADLKQLDFKVTQGAGETRIAAAAGVGAVMAQFSEGLQGSSLNAGNYQAAKRRFADGTMRPNWRTAAAALQSLAPPPPSARLWYDDRDIKFLQDDEKDAADIFSRRMLTVESGIRAGFTPDSVARAVDAGDLTLLEHTGLYSVQLQKPGDLRVAPPAPAQEG